MSRMDFLLAVPSGVCIAPEGVLVVAFCLLNVYLLSKSADDPGAGTNQLPAGRSPEADLHLTEHKQRVDQVIKDLGAMDYPELVRDLGEHNHHFEIAQMAAIASPMTGMAPHQLRQVLGDRRTSRAIEFLQGLPELRRKQEASRLFHEKLTTLSRLAESPEAAQANFWRIQANYHAAHVALFINVLVCDPDDFLDHCDTWVSNQDVVPPDSLFLMSVYLMALSKRDGVSPDELEVRLSKLGRKLDLALPPLTNFSVYSWSAQTTDLDFTHRHRGAAPEKSAVIETVIGFDDWDSLLAMSQQERHQIAASSIRSWFD